MALLLPRLMSCCSNFACSVVIVEGAGICCFGFGPRLFGVGCWGWVCGCNGEYGFWRDFWSCWSIELERLLLLLFFCTIISVSAGSLADARTEDLRREFVFGCCCWVWEAYCSKSLVRSDWEVFWVRGCFWRRGGGCCCCCWGCACLPRFCWGLLIEFERPREEDLLLCWAAAAATCCWCCCCCCC